MINLKKLFYNLVGLVYIPNHLLNTNEKILLHISDTPANFFFALQSLLKELQPDYIVHTGDFVDNIKLEIYPYKIDEYKNKLNQLIKILETSSAKEIYLTLGNHDDKNIVNNITKRTILIEKSAIIHIEGIDLKISHYPSEIINSFTKYNLFGHDLTIESKMENEKIYLNGVSGINIIMLQSKNILTLSYPYGTNDSRLGMRKIGF